eukprot:jgi/Mesen1/8303/ME000455S07470
MSSYNKIVSGKLNLKGGLGIEKLIGKKKKKKQKKSVAEVEAHTNEEGEGEGEDLLKAGKADDKDEIDTGTGFAPGGSKKSKKYEELFPVETRRFGFIAPELAKSREDAVVERSKKKADRYCK